MNIEKAIELLSAIENDWLVPTKGFGFPDSYRGYYDEVAFPSLNTASISDMICYLWTAKSGKKFTGYKGGEYVYSDTTPCHLSEAGTCKENDDEMFAELILNAVAEAGTE